MTRLGIGITSIAVATLMSCATTTQSSGTDDIHSPISEVTQPVSAQSPYFPTILGPGSEVEFKFFFTPELNDIQTVRSDGMVSMQFLGDVEASGLTPAELQSNLMKEYGNHLNDPEITVIVRSVAHQQVVVGGEVVRPGLVDLSTPLTALEALMRVGGPDMRQANLKNVVVIRHKGDHRQAFALDLKPTLKGGAVAPFYLKPHDIVYVPRTTIAKLGQWVDQHINQLVPQLGLNYTDTMGTSRMQVNTSNRR